MLRILTARTAFFLGFVALMMAPVLAQDAGQVNPPSTRGPNPLMGGLFVTPVPGASFSATVVIESSRPLQDGTTEKFRTISHVARDASGKIYNERRLLVPATTDEEGRLPRLLSMHIYDPQTRLNTFLNPVNHLARQSLLANLPRTEAPSPASPTAVPVKDGSPFVREEDLGVQTMENMIVHGVRVTRTVPAPRSGTGNPEVIVDEYWYSYDLHINMQVKHNDPRTGEQTLTVTRVSRNEPNAVMFQVPAGYKVVDETPENPGNQN